MKTRLILTVALLGVFAFGAQRAWGYTNPPVPNAQGVTTETCDVRNDQDSGEKSLRQRVELFNANQSCLFGIYFLDAYTIKLTQPLRIKGLKHELLNGKMAGTYISGAKTDGNALPVVIDAGDVTDEAGQCAVMIEGGLESIQQIHDVTFKVTSAARVVCDENGNDLMEQVIPENDVRKNCEAGVKAKNCDFKDVNIELVPGSNPVKPVCELNAAESGDGFDLTWNTTDATAANLSDGSTTLSTDLDSEEPLHVTPTAETTYTLTATGAGGDCTDTVTVTPDPAQTRPTCDISASPSGNGFNLSWTTDNATLAAISDGTFVLSDDLDSSTPLFVEPDEETTYRLTATGLGGSCQDEVTVTPPNPTPPPTCDIAATATEGSVRLLWVTENATTAAVSDGTTTLSTELNPSDPLPVNPTQTTTYTLTATGAGGECQDAVTVEVDGGTTPADADGDGVANEGDNCPAIPNPNQEDGDGDGIGDVCESPTGGSTTDTDGDGLTDEEETAAGTDPAKPDTDDDGVDDKTDNCALISNGPETEDVKEDEIQSDEDENGVGDACDPNFSESGGPGGIQGCGCRLDTPSRPWGTQEAVLAALALAVLATLRVVRQRRP